MMRLPALLQPWSPWLSLFPDDLAGTLGTLMLRLAPLLGPLRRHAAPQALEPAGIGDIVRRGSYERLLISEWAYADAAPDEFLRRAANGELLFTGPEPANSEQSLRSVVLFDAGPAQLGEARLVHLALFILLARRAQQAGAEFQWGVLQCPGTLHAAHDEQAQRALLDARTWSALDADGLQQWNTALDGTAADCWLVGDAGAPVPAPVSASVLVRRSWLADELEVTLRQRRHSRSLTLPLPAPADSVRLLRRPFDAPTPAAGARVPSGTHSLKRAPMFSIQRGWLATNMVDGSVTVYHVPDTPQDKPGRARNGGKLLHLDYIVAAGLLHKAVGSVVLSGDFLRLQGFPGPFFRDGSAALPLPEPDMFQAVPGALRWMPVFHLLQSHQIVSEQVCVLDKAGRLVGWTRTGAQRERTPERTAFRLIARDVIGAAQHGDTLLFAVGLTERTDVYSLRAGQSTPAHVVALMHAGDRFLFGDVKAWRRDGGSYALRIGNNAWHVGDRQAAATIAIDDKDIMLGVARRAQDERLGAVVLDANRSRIVLHAGGARVTLVTSAEPIAQASFDPITHRLAWLGQKSGTLTVRGFDGADDLLRVLPRERGSHEA